MAEGFEAGGEGEEDALLGCGRGLRKETERKGKRSRVDV